MDLVAFALCAFVGTVFWVVNPEAAAVLGVTERGWSPLVVGLLAAVGQGLAQVILYAFGDQIRARWSWFDRQCARLRTRWGTHMQRGVVALGASSGLLSLPPISATAVLAPGLGLSARSLLPVLFVARVVRFGLIAALAAHIGAFFTR